MKLSDTAIQGIQTPLLACSLCCDEKKKDCCKKYKKGKRCKKCPDH